MFTAGLRASIRFKIPLLASIQMFKTAIINITLQAYNKVKSFKISQSHIFKNRPYKAPTKNLNILGYLGVCASMTKYFQSKK